MRGGGRDRRDRGASNTSTLCYACFANGDRPLIDRGKGPEKLKILISNHKAGYDLPLSSITLHPLPESPTQVLAGHAIGPKRLEI